MNDYLMFECTMDVLTSPFKEWRIERSQNFASARKYVEKKNTVSRQKCIQKMIDLQDWVY